MAFVNHKQEIIRKIIQKRVRSASGRSAAYVARIVFNSAAKADFAHHFNVVKRAFGKSLRFKQLVLCFKLRKTLVQLFLN